MYSICRVQVILSVQTKWTRQMQISAPDVLSYTEFLIFIKSNSAIEVTKLWSTKALLKKDFIQTQFRKWGRKSFV